MSLVFSPRWFFPLILLGWVAGCQSSVSRGGHPETAPAAEESDDDMERRVQALAAFSAGVLLTEREEPDAAYEQFARAAEADPGNEAIALDLARHYLQKNQPEQALTVLQRTAAQPGSSGVIQALLADTLWRAGKADAAIRTYDKAIRATPTLLGAYQQLAVIYLERKKPSEALSVLERTFSITNDSPTFWLNTGELFSWFGRVEPSQKVAAEADLRQALERAASLDSKEPGDLMRLGRAYLELGENAKAESLFEAINDKLPKNITVAASLAELLIRDGRLKEAREHLELLSKANPTSHFPWYFLGVIELEEKDFAGAERMFERTLNLNPEFEPAYGDLAVTYLNQKNGTAALEVLRRGLDRSPTSFRMVYLSALAEASLEHYDKSLTAFKKAEALAGDKSGELLDYQYYFQVGFMLSQAGREAESVEYLEKSLALNPEYDEALNHLGYTWVEQGTNLERALDMIERAVAAEPENPAYLDSLGWALFKLKRPAEALPPLEKAVELLPEPDATVYDHLGDVLTALGRKAEAREAWEKSLKVEKSEPVQKKLDSIPRSGQ